MERNPKATLSAIVMGLGALVVGAGFVLPWFSMLGVGESGMQVASGPGAAYLYLLPAAALVGLIWAIFVGNKGSSSAMASLVGVGIAVLALLPIVIMFVQIQSASAQAGDLGGAISGLAMQMLSAGFWVTIIGGVVMLVGALISFGARPVEGGFVGMVGVQQTIVASQTQVAAPPPQPFTPPTVQSSYPPTAVSNPSVVAAPVEKTKPIGGQPAPAAWLVMQGGPRHGQQFGLKRGDNNLGRNGNQADVVIDDSSVSGQHARVRYENGQFWLYDLASTNGTYINNARIQKQILYDNDRVRLGEVTLVFKMVDQRR